MIGSAGMETTGDITTYERELAAAGYSQKTIRAKVGAVASCARWAGVEPHELTRDDVVAWLAHRPLAAWSRRKYVEHLSAWAGHIGRDDLTDGIRKPAGPRGLPRPVSDAGYAAMLRVSAPGRERAWLLLGALCGLRAHESAKVAAEDLEQAPDGSWLLRVLGKGGQLAVIPCPPVVVDELRAEARRAGQGRLWPRATSESVQRKVVTLAERAGVVCTSHQLRHRYGTTVYHQSGNDLLLTQQMMRHKSPATTAVYAQVAGGRAYQVAAALPGAEVAGAGERPHLRLVR